MTSPTVVGNIRPELADLVVPIDQVTGYPDNPRRGDHTRLRASLTAHGQYKPLLIQQSTGYVVAGNNTLQVIRDLGWTHVAVLHLDVDDEHAKAMLLVDNRTSDDAEYDDKALVAMLADLPDIDLTGWTTTELDDLLRQTDTLGDQAAAFLDPLLNPTPPAPLPAPPPGAPPSPFPPAPAPASGAPPAPAPTPAAGGTTVLPGPEPAGQYTPPPAASEPSWVQVAWACTTDQREILWGAIRRAQDHSGDRSTTQITALVAVAQHYLDTTGDTE